MFIVSMQRCNLANVWYNSFIGFVYLLNSNSARAGNSMFTKSVIRTACVILHFLIYWTAFRNKCNYLCLTIND